MMQFLGSQKLKLNTNKKGCNIEMRSTQRKKHMKIDLYFVCWKCDFEKLFF